jgi:hypothetical protein
MRLPCMTSPSNDILNPMKHTEAYARFIRSMELDYEKWHDGEGYDLDAIAEIQPEELEELVATLSGGDVTWRDVEALARIDLPAARQAIITATQHHLSIDTRLAAAEALHEKGEMPEIDLFLSRQIRELSRVSNGCTRALLMAEDFPTVAVKQALLWASYNRTECAMHCAGVLCYLCGVGKEPFDWDLRPLFLRLGDHESHFERQAAFDELCKLVNMQIDYSWQ